jgi:Ras-related C3 botulinum toxin substrate 1
VFGLGSDPLIRNDSVFNRPAFNMTTEKPLLKLMFIGDTAVGKTSMLISYTTNSFPGDHVPTVFDNYTATTIYKEHAIRMGLWDTSGSSDYDKMRPLSYPGTDCFILCFSINDKDSFEHVKSKWVPEIKAHTTDEIPFLLVGTKLDLRDDDNDNKDRLISVEQGKDLAKEINASDYVECSALTQNNLKGVFEAIVKAVWEAHQSNSEDDAHHDKEPKRKLSSGSKSKDKHSKKNKDEDGSKPSKHKKKKSCIIQ